MASKYPTENYFVAGPQSSYPHKTVDIEWIEPRVWADRQYLNPKIVASHPMLNVMQLKRNGNCLEITMSRRELGVAKLVAQKKWHNISRIRYVAPRNTYLNPSIRADTHFEFIGKDEYGREVTMDVEHELGPWACWDIAFHKRKGNHDLEALGLTKKDIFDWEAFMSEYSCT